MRPLKGTLVNYHLFFERHLSPSLALRTRGADLPTRNRLLVPLI